MTDEIEQYLPPDVTEWEKPESETEALARWVEVFSDGHLAADVGMRFNCSEVNAIIELLRAAGVPEAAQSWRDGHAADDDCGDQHFTEVFCCSTCSKWRDTEERIVDNTDTGPGDYCTACASKPWS